MTQTVSVLGCGTIGTRLIEAFANGELDDELVTVYDEHTASAEAAADMFEKPPDVAQSPDKLIDADLVVEAAGHGALEAVGVSVLRAGADLLPMSVGALADADLREPILDATVSSETGSLWIPSGAIAGLDAIKTAASAGGLESVTLTTIKPPAGLAGASYLVENEIDVTSVKEATTVFEGSATDAATAFPSNVNVAMSLSLAGIGPEATTVEIVADPTAENNQHRISASGSAGTIETTVRNVPSPTNPKTSYLAALSAIQTIRGRTETVHVGT